MIITEVNFQNKHSSILIDIAYISHRVETLITYCMHVYSH